VRSPLFRKYAVVLAGLVVVALFAGGAVNMWFAYQEGRAAQSQLLSQQAEAAAGQMQQFVAEIAGQLGWMTQLP
jgi:hypothetical protein